MIAAEVAVALTLAFLATAAAVLYVREDPR
jgi:hypothetical protein